MSIKEGSTLSWIWTSWVSLQITRKDKSPKPSFFLDGPQINENQQVDYDTTKSKGASLKYLARF